MDGTMKLDDVKKVRTQDSTNLCPIQSVAAGDFEETDDIDDAILRAQGHEAAMHRQFNWISALGLAFSITNSWVGYLSCFGQNLKYFGPQSCVFGLIAAFAVQSTVTGGLSELASAFPSSGGQYHFSYVMIKGKSRNFVAYCVGWLSVVAWWIVTCSGLSLSAVTLTGLIQFWHPSFEGAQWQIYLLYVAIATITHRSRLHRHRFLPLFLVPRRISWTVQATLYLSVIGCVIFLIFTCSMHQSVQPADFVLRSDLGSSGWGSGVAWLLRISNAMYAFGGTDGVIHISEEMPQPGRRVPQVMAATMVLGLVTTLPLITCLVYFAQDIEEVSTAIVPSIAIVQQAIGNKALTTFLFAWLWIVYSASIPSQWVTSGRIAWAFARDGGIPFPSYFSAIDPKLGFSVRTTLAAFVFACVYGLLYLAWLTAFNSIVTSAVRFLNVFYAAPQLILLWNGRKLLPPRYLNLGRIGYLVNIFSVGWVAFLIVLICMPPALPVEMASMNWTSVVVAGLIVLVLSLWFSVGKRQFNGPDIDWDLLQMSNQAAMH